MRLIESVKRMNVIASKELSMLSSMLSISAENPMVSEQRKDGDRRRAFVPGKVVAEPPHFTGYCTVRDLSPGGAKLAFGAIPKLPDVFELQIPSQGKSHEVELRWQRGLQIGVQILSSRKYVES
jgi:PilZ domain